MSLRVPAYFSGVAGVRLLFTAMGWLVQYHPNFDNQATEGWITVGNPYQCRARAEEDAPFIVPETHEF